MRTNSGRSPRSGSVVYSSRAKRVKALPLVLSSISPWRPPRTLADAVRPDLHARHPVVVARAREDLAGDPVEAQLAAAHAQRLHHRVGGDHALADVREEALQRGALVAGRLAQDEVLHRVGGDHVRVVALGVGGREVVAQHLDADLAGEHVVARDPVDGDAQLAVGDPHSASSSRSRAILAISSSATRISSSSLLASRSDATRRIDSLVCSRAQTTNGKPKRSR